MGRMQGPQKKKPNRLRKKKTSPRFKQIAKKIHAAAQKSS
jgi:hypothetical protein